MKKFILIYIALRFVIAAFYSTNFLGFRITEIAGTIFPLTLLIYYLNSPYKHMVHNLSRHLGLMVLWIGISSILVHLTFNFPNRLLFKQFFRFFNGYMVFLVFPIVFYTKKDINDLLNAFLICTIFPAAQVIGQYLGILNLNTKGVGSDIYMFEGVYGNHGIFGLIAWIGSVTIIAKQYFIKKRKSEILYIIAFCIFIAIGLLTLSRTIMLIVLIVFLSFVQLIFSRKNFGIAIGFSIIIMLFTYSDAFDYASQGLLKRSEKEFEVLRGDADISMGLHGRVSRWDHNLISFRINYSLFNRLTGTNLFIGPHGDYFFWMFSYGVIGLALYLSFLMRLFYNVRKRKLLDHNNYQIQLYGKAVLTSIGVWYIMAVATNPSFMPDFTLYVFGNASVFLSYNKENEG